MTVTEMDSRIRDILETTLAEFEIAEIDRYFGDISDPTEAILKIMKFSAGMEKVAKLYKSIIPILEECAGGTLPENVHKVTRKTYTVDMDVLRLCHKDVVNKLIEDGKFKVSATDLKKFEGVDDAITESQTTYYKME